MAEVHYPKIEAYDGYLYLILHGIDFRAGDKDFATHDVDFFVGPTYLVTVHDGHSRSIRGLQESLARRAQIMKSLDLKRRRDEPRPVGVSLRTC